MENMKSTENPKKAENPGQSIIETRGLTKFYGEKCAVDNLDLSIRKGEVFGLLGPNGAGKTTTILMLLGLTEPSGGTATIKGIDCTRDPVSVKRIVGYMPDNVGFYGDLTGRENLRFTGKLNGIYGKELDERVDSLLERVGMADAGNLKVSAYSKGMHQRLGIADVLMKDPEIIIMDEPTVGIDPEGMREVLSLMRRLSREDGRTLLISSHQLYQIQQICDRVGIFVNGRLIACGPISELGQQIQSETHYTLELETQPSDAELLSEIVKQPGVENVSKDGHQFLIESVTDLRENLTAFLGSRGYKILHLHQRGGDLDEIYRLYFERAEQQDESNRIKKGRGKNRLPGARFGGGK